MPAEGPQVTRLRTALSGASDDQVRTASEAWLQGAAVVEVVGSALRQAASLVADQLGPQTSERAATAFRTMADEVDDRRLQMLDAAEALVLAGSAMARAEAVRDRLDASPLHEPDELRPEPGAGRVDDLQAVRAHHAQVAAFDAAFAAREEEARHAVDQMDAAYAGSTEVMRRIHGLPDGAGAVAADDGPVGAGAGPATGGPHVATGPRAATPSLDGRGPAVGQPGDPAVDEGHRSADPATSDGDGGPVLTNVPLGTPDGAPVPTSGIAQGPGVSPPDGAPGSLVGDPEPAVLPGASAGAASGGPPGLLGGGLAAGAAALGGVVRGGSPLPPGVATGAGQRALGSTTRTGAAGPLGRATPAGVPVSPTGRGPVGGAPPGARGAAAGGAGVRGAGVPGQAAGRAPGGGRGGAGRSGGRAAGVSARGAAPPSGAPRRRSKGEADPGSELADARDWVDDEQGESGVLGL